MLSYHAFVAYVFNMRISCEPCIEMQRETVTENMQKIVTRRGGEIVDTLVRN